jgi:hypothetical protein
VFFYFFDLIVKFIIENEDVIRHNLLFQPISTEDFSGDMRKQGTVAPQKEYSKAERQGKMTYKDFAKAQEYGAKAKEKYKQRLQTT